MAQILVRGLDEDVKRRLKLRAERNGRSMEDEIRTILRDAVRRPLARAVGLGSAIAARMSASGATLDSPLPELRGAGVRPARFRG